MKQIEQQIEKWKTFWRKWKTWENKSNLKHVETNFEKKKNHWKQTLKTSWKTCWTKLKKNDKQIENKLTMIYKK